MSLRAWLLMLSAALVMAPPGKAQSHRFESETVVMEVESDSLKITGHYVLSQHQAVPTTLFYPFPRDKDLGGVRTLSLAYRAVGGIWQTMESKDLSEGLGTLWEVPAVEADTLEVHTVYRQARLADFGLYIVTSMQSWEHPLRHAVFEVVLPLGALDPIFSFPFELCPEDEPDGRTRYRFEARDFRPEKNIAVRWDQAGADTTNSQPQ